jgi:hypothetical protein
MDTCRKMFRNLRSNRLTFLIDMILVSLQRRNLFVKESFRLASSSKVFDEMNEAK